ncbi:MAG: threonine aldolase [Opitutia bacterium Tous-C8FEB]|nr:MAG: threonine aldolase [Opitutae bacterium Tous-C8FEB]
MSVDADWMRLADEPALATPTLVVFPERIEENLRRMIARAGDPARLRPHVKTHKLPALVALQVRLGITRCKCATIAEAEMAAGAGAAEVTLAAQPVGPNAGRLVELARAFPAVRFSTLVDDPGALAGLSAAAAGGAAMLEVLLDLDVGMGRTGIVPGPAAVDLYAAIATAPGLRPGGLHAYDGHLRQRVLEERVAAAAPAVARVDAMRAELVARGLPVPRVVWGGTPTFPVHARRPGVELSPGTCVLWDAGYGAGLPDLDFLPAAALLTRVISRPGTGRLCLDLGHKAVASEMPHPRVMFPELPDALAVTHSEEHLVLETARAADFPVGTVLHGIPWHICPTVALHDRVLVARGGRTVERWPVVARARRLNF